MACNVIKKETLTQLFPVNFAKLLRKIKKKKKTLLVAASVLGLSKSFWEIILEVSVAKNRELNFHKTLLIELSSKTEECKSKCFIESKIDSNQCPPN